jgi:hypothetical protein
MQVLPASWRAIERNCATLKLLRSRGAFRRAEPELTPQPGELVNVFAPS